MDNALLITEKEISLINIFEIVSLDLTFVRESDKVINYSCGKFFLSIIDNGQELNKNDYEKQELSLINRRIKYPKSFVLDSNNFELISRLVKSLSSKIQLLIDNDYGRILVSEELLKMTSFEELFSP